MAEDDVPTVVPVMTAKINANDASMDVGAEPKSLITTSGLYQAKSWNLGVTADAGKQPPPPTDNRSYKVAAAAAAKAAKAGDKVDASAWAAAERHQAALAASQQEAASRTAARREKQGRRGAALAAGALEALAERASFGSVDATSGLYQPTCSQLVGLHDPTATRRQVRVCVCFCVGSWEHVQALEHVVHTWV
jgi:hypothetical protein